MVKKEKKAKNKSAQKYHSDVRSDRPRPMRKISYQPRFVAMSVLSAELLSPTVMRVVLIPTEAGSGVYSQGLVGEYVRVVVPPLGSEIVEEPRWSDSKSGPWPVWDKPSPPMRKYTIRRYWAESGAIEINVTLHSTGPGSAWARTVRAGAKTFVWGPKSGYRISYDYDYYLMVCDETGLPGVARFLEQLPATAGGEVFAQVPNLESVQEISSPPGVSVHWLSAEDDLAERVMALSQPDLEVFAWIAGESTVIRPLRGWIRHQWNVEKSDSYSSGYWKNKSEK